MQHILCSTGALLGRPNGRDFHLLPAFCDQLMCDGLEFMLYDSWYPQLDRLFHVLQGLSKPIYTFHMEKSICTRLLSPDEHIASQAMDHFRINCQLASALHVPLLVLHLWDGRMAHETIRSAIGRFPGLCEIAASMGLQLTVENIVTLQFDPLFYCRLLLENTPGALFTYDTKMAAFHHQESALYQPENQAVLRSIRHLHLNDYSGGYMEWSKFKTLHPGDGQVDFPGLMLRMAAAGYTGHITAEATSFDSTGQVDMTRLNHTLQYLRQLTKQEMCK